VTSEAIWWLVSLWASLAPCHRTTHCVADHSHRRKWQLMNILPCLTLPANHT